MSNSGERQSLVDKSHTERSNPSNVADAHQSNAEINAVHSGDAAGSSETTKKQCWAQVNYT